MVVQFNRLLPFLLNGVDPEAHTPGSFFRSDELLACGERH
jgi:hypothetical protein